MAKGSGGTRTSRASGRYSSALRETRQRLASANRLTRPTYERNLEYFTEANRLSNLYRQGAYVRVQTSSGEIRGNIDYTDRDVRVRVSEGGTRVLNLDELKRVYKN